MRSASHTQIKAAFHDATCAKCVSNVTAPSQGWARASSHGEGAGGGAGGVEGGGAEWERAAAAAAAAAIAAQAARRCAGDAVQRSGLAATRAGLAVGSAWVPVPRYARVNLRVTSRGEVVE